ncbi:uncharacterized protein LOC141679853 [Apium graveolens]|uniref:uncharacterized protein LOC141679853 n=1 Tax=Apium graveolens TaxID=4045 RepID=UPI003D799023
MADFRPISLCTVMYKCISKILASRLKLIMPTVVDIAQSAFIPGRSISDNILLAQELFRGYERETGTAKCALKIDLHKAFDSLHWDFILAVLVRFKFPDIVIKWLKACLFTTKFSVKLNGIIHGYFKGTQAWSGLSPSINKSHNYLCNCDSNFTTWFDTLLIPRGTLPVRFLGVPLITTQLCVNDCMPLINRITSKLNSWTSLLLSLAGRTLLIKSVILSLESFWCNHFLLPATVHANIQSLLTKFLWRGNINQKGGAKMSWQTVCLPREEGGLGLKNMCEWNKSQIIGHLLKVVTKSPTLWASWVNKTVLKGKHFWVTKLPSDCSWIWKKLLKLRPLAMSFLSYKIGTGESISVWFDPWWHHTCLASSVSSPIISQSGLHHRDTLAALIRNGVWSLPTANPRSHHLDPLLLSWLANFEFPQLHAGMHTINGLLATADFIPLLVFTDSVWWKHNNAFCVFVAEKQNPTCFCIARTVIGLLEDLCHHWISIFTEILGTVSLVQLQDSSKSTLALCVSQIFCYHIWRERNARLHGMGIFGPRKLLEGIKKDFIARLDSSIWFSKVLDSRPDFIHYTRL